MFILAIFFKKKASFKALKVFVLEIYPMLCIEICQNPKRKGEGDSKTSLD
jgi:hypothetical protein